MRNLYYVECVDLQRMRDAAQAATEDAVLHFHPHGEPCLGNQHEEFPKEGLNGRG